MQILFIEYELVPAVSKFFPLIVYPFSEGKQKQILKSCFPGQYNIKSQIASPENILSPINFQTTGDTCKLTNADKEMICTHIKQLRKSLARSSLPGLIKVNLTLHIGTDMPGQPV